MESVKDQIGVPDNIEDNVEEEELKEEEDNKSEQDSGSMHLKDAEKEEARQLFDEVDENGDDLIDFQDLIKLLESTLLNRVGLSTGGR